MAVKTTFDPIPSSLVKGEELSRGSYGVVYSATLDEGPVAVKQFHKVLLSDESIHLQSFKRECEQLKRLNHPNVVKYIGAYQGENGPILVMELMYETLKTYLERNKGNLPPSRVMEMCSAVCGGLSHLHGLKNPLIHRDLSNKNVLLTKGGIVKIADFGQAKLLGDLKDTLQTTQPGTILYMPPEALEKKKNYTAKVDSFSLGVLLLEICTQSPPSSSFGGIGTIEEVKRREDDLRLLDDAHPLKPLIVWCLQYEELRPTVAGIHNHVTSYPRQIAHLKDKLDAANGETARLRKLLDVTEEKLRNQFLQVEKITGELEVSTEETNGLEQGLKELQEKCQFLQEQLEVNRADFEQERKDREEAAGRYEVNKKEFMDEIQTFTEKNLRQADEIHGLKQDLEEERRQRGILDGKLKDQLHSLREVGIERDELKAEALLMKEALVTSKQENMEKLMMRDEEIHQLKQIIDGLQQRVNAQTIEVDQNTFVFVASGESSSLQQNNEVLPILEAECIRLREELKKQKANHDLQLQTVRESLKQSLQANNDINIECKELRVSQSKLKGQLSSSRVKVNEVTNHFISARGEARKWKDYFNSAKKDLDTAQEVIDAKIQHEAILTRELKASSEEKNQLKKDCKDLQDKCQALQLQLDLNKGDVEQERHDRETAAGRYEEEKEQLLKTIEDLQQSMKEKDDQIFILNEDLRQAKSQKRSRGGWLRHGQDEESETTLEKLLAMNSRLVGQQALDLIKYEKRLKDRDSRHKDEVAALEERVLSLLRENEAAQTDKKDHVTARKDIEKLHREN